jgi:hypothetical protein
MSVQTLCQICESAVATHQCDRCGVLVCSVHYDEDSGLCTECARQTADGASD